MNSIADPPRSRTVFLDLEGTLIDDWNTRNFLAYNAEHILQSGILLGTDVAVGIMSWALWDTRDAAVFTESMLPELQAFLGVQINTSLPLTMDQWADDLLRYRKLRVSRDDIFDIFQKPEILLSMARFNPLFFGRDIILIDDAFEHGTRIDVPSTDTRVRLINISAPLETW